MQSTALILKSLEYRKAILKIVKHKETATYSGSLSCVDILNVLYNHTMNVSPKTLHSPYRDRFVHSKSHSIEALYVVLADKGFFSHLALETVQQYQSVYIGNPTRDVNGIEQNTGAPGHGLSVAVGMALAAKLDKQPYRVFTLLGDDELSEGSNWEALMTAARYKLDNLVVIVDRSRFYTTGRTDDITDIEPLTNKLVDFGVALRGCDGHKISDLTAIFEQLPFDPGKPNLILAYTTKGKGVSFIQKYVHRHHKVPSDDEYALALQELDQAIVEVKAHDK